MYVKNIRNIQDDEGQDGSRSFDQDDGTSNYDNMDVRTSESMIYSNCDVQESFCSRSALVQEYGENFPQDYSQTSSKRATAERLVL